MGLRFVIKRELHALPTIDIGGRWLPTYFVRAGPATRRARSPPREPPRTSARRGDPDLPRGHPEDGRQACSRAGDHRRAPTRDRAAGGGLRNVLPPRLGGPLRCSSAAGRRRRLLRARGFDGFAKVSDIWAGSLVGGMIRVRFWRHAASDDPVRSGGANAWLYERWQEVDDWVGSHRVPGETVPQREPSVA